MATTNRPRLFSASAVTLFLSVAGTACLPSRAPTPDTVPNADSEELSETEATSSEESTSSSGAVNTDLPPEDPQIDSAPKPSTAESYTTTPPIGSFSTDELFAAGGGGCGMSLWRADANPLEDGYIFFNGLDAAAIMQLDGEMVTLSRDKVTGEEFYGQYLSQTFVAPDDALSATVNVVLGEPGEIESVAIPAGTLLLQSGGDVTEISVVGDAGC
ncbi:MAG: hypothetical protein WBA10_13760 [Elainellaceae cyanobacterium]